MQTPGTKANEEIETARVSAVAGSRSEAHDSAAARFVAENGAHDGNGAHDEAADRYRRLPTGAHGLAREVVERDQRERLQTAMIELIAQRGYPSLRIVDLTKLAHVSRPTFYSLYRDKEDLLISAYDDIARRTGEAVMSSYVADGSPRERLQVAMRTFTERAAAESDAMSLFLFGAFGAGAKMLERRNASLDALEQSIEVSRGTTTPRKPVANLMVKVIIGGIREVTATRLRTQRASELPELAEELTAWAACYPPKLPPGLASPPAVRRDPGEAQQLASARSQRAQGRLPSGRHDLSREYVVKNQRERIVDATAAIVAEKGLSGLTIPEIASRASVSHETFYEMYATKQDAFLGAQKVGMHQAFIIAVGAYEAHKREYWPRGIAEGLRALVGFLQSEPAHAHLSIVDTFAASPETLAIRDEVLAGFAVYFRPGERPPYEGFDAPEIAPEAVVGGVWQVLHHYVENGSFDELEQALPQLTYMLLTPFIGPKEAAKAARRPPAGGEESSVEESSAPAGG